jgi:hypothetical protein
MKRVGRDDGNYHQGNFIEGMMIAAGICILLYSVIWIIAEIWGP